MMLFTMWSMSFLGGMVGMPSNGNSIVAISSNTSACASLGVISCLLALRFPAGLHMRPSPVTQ